MQFKIRSDLTDHAEKSPASNNALQMHFRCLYSVVLMSFEDPSLRRGIMLLVVLSVPGYLGFKSTAESFYVQKVCQSKQSFVCFGTVSLR